MYYVPKPVPVEAVYLDSIHTGIEFLHTGEYVLLSTTTITIRGEDGILMRAHVGCDVLVRDPIDGIQIWDKAQFDADFVPLEGAACAFEAYDSNDGTWTIECAECGPIGVTNDMTDFTNIGQEHLESVHMGVES